MKWLSPPSTAPAPVPPAISKTKRCRIDWSTWTSPLRDTHAQDTVHVHHLATPDQAGAATDADGIRRTALQAQYTQWRQTAQLRQWQTDLPQFKAQRHQHLIEQRRCGGIGLLLCSHR